MTPKPRIAPSKRLVIRTPLLRLIRKADLTVVVDGPTQAAAGTSVDLTVTVFNKGVVAAPGRLDSETNFWMVDIILSSDENVPVEWGVWPGYAGKTADDFLEDMLMQGGRVSNTNTIPPGGKAQHTLTNIYIPKNIPPGVYYLTAVVDPGKRTDESNENNNIYYYKISIAPPDMGPVRAPGGVWIMPYAVGDTPLNKIKPTGLTDYRDSGSGLVMQDAPFAGRLGFRHGYHKSIPTTAIKYYRWLYKATGAPAWTEFSESVAVHYVKEVGTTTTFPVYLLGPQGVGGKNLYEFRPHSAPTIPGATTYWPTTDWFGDIYSAFLKSAAILDGTYAIKLEVYNAAGAQVMPGSAFRFIVPRNVLPDRTITTRPAAAPEIDAGGFVFKLHVDNHKCQAIVDPPQIGGAVVTGPCGFLLYANKATDKVTLGFHATHPNGFARFSLRVVRGVTPVAAAMASGEITAILAGAYAGDGAGNFSADFPIPTLLGPSCPEKAAFAERLYVYAKATSGWRHRAGGLDASALRAFALAPR